MDEVRSWMMALRVHRRRNRIKKEEDIKNSIYTYIKYNIGMFFKNRISNKQVFIAGEVLKKS